MSSTVIYMQIRSNLRLLLPWWPTRTNDTTNRRREDVEHECMQGWCRIWLRGLRPRWKYGHDSEFWYDGQNLEWRRWENILQGPIKFRSSHVRRRWQRRWWDTFQGRRLDDWGWWKFCCCGIIWRCIDGYWAVHRRFACDYRGLFYGKYLPSPWKKI